jgi:hypothetical protein
MTNSKAQNKIPREVLADGKLIEDIFRRAVRHALLEHKRAGNSIAVWQDGRVVIIPPEEIPVEDPLGDEQVR